MTVTPKPSLHFDKGSTDSSLFWGADLGAFPSVSDDFLDHP
jgi:hypothetical protein